MITIIPAIDIIAGKCVRLTRGDFQSQKIYNENPLQVAREFESSGIRRLHLVDLDGARQKRIVNAKVLEEIAAGTGLHIDFGGGIQSEQDIGMAFDCGAQQITAGSIAVQNREMVIGWINKFGSEKIILGTDNYNGKIAVNAWQEQTDNDLFSFIQDYLKVGIRQTICTDAERDGLLQGPSFELYQTIKAQFPKLHLIASGGVSSIRDIEKLDQLNIDGVIIGKALYEGSIQLGELKPFLC